MLQASFCNLTEVASKWLFNNTQMSFCARKMLSSRNEVTSHALSLRSGGRDEGVGYHHHLSRRWNDVLRLWRHPTHKERRQDPYKSKVVF